MESAQLIIGLLFLIASTITRIYLLNQKTKATQVQSRISILPRYRDEAFVFSFQLSGLLEIIVALLYGELNFDVYLKLPFIGAIFLQVLYFGPVVLGFILSAMVVKIKNL